MLEIYIRWVGSVTLIFCATLMFLSLSEPVSVGIDPPSRTTPGADVDLCKCLLGYELITLDVSEFGTSQD